MSRKGVFIPDITVEMFRNATLESVEECMTSGQMEDIEIPDRPRGTWTEEFDESANPFFQRRWRCSACNDYNYYGRPEFCPHCGADMRKEGEAE